MWNLSVPIALEPRFSQVLPGMLFSSDLCL